MESRHGCRLARDTRPPGMWSLPGRVGRRLPRMTWPTVSTHHHDGHTYRARRLGLDSGHQLVLVHGIGVAGRYYLPLARVLARSAGVHVLELPGFGGTPKPQAPLSVAQLAAVVNAYVRSADLDRPTLVGHSMGAQVVLEAALRAPGLVSAVVVMGCVVDPQERTARQQGLRLVQDVLLETPAANVTVLSEYVRTGPRWFAKTLPAMLGYQTEVAVARLGVPLLIVRGTRDPVAGHAWAQQLQRLAPAARLVEVAGGAHAVMYTHPHEVASAILSHTWSVDPTEHSTVKGPPLYDPSVQQRVGEPKQTVEDRLAQLLAGRAGVGRALAKPLEELAELDRAVYQAVASTSTPELDSHYRRLSRVADHSVLWLGIAAALAVGGGRSGRRAAVESLVAIGAASATVNLGIKPLARRRRPDRAEPARFEARVVPMPESASFPSGHAASAFAFAYAVGRHRPELAVPLRLLAGGVAYSRVHTGVHYPGDVVVGAILGGGIAAMVAAAVDRRLQPGCRGQVRSGWLPHGWRRGPACPQ